jgi:hypothetical protein
MDLQRDEGDGHRLSLYWRLEHGHPFNQYDHTILAKSSLKQKVQNDRNNILLCCHHDAIINITILAD